MLNLKLPHNPLFHIYKALMDVMTDNELKEGEIDR
jgi:hypothetical protein